MIKKNISKLFAVFALVAGISLISTLEVNAQSAPQKVASGKDTSTITWTLYDNGDLKFTGTGDMNDYLEPDTYETTGTQGWYRYRRNTKKIIIGDGITSVGDAAFCDFPITEIELPVSTLTEIGTASFSNNDKLEKIVIPKSVRKIGAAAFKGCAASKEIVIKGSVKTIETECFTGMSDALVTVASGCVELKSKAFYGSLTRIELPSSVKKISSDAMDKSNKWKLIKGGSAEVKLYANNNYIPYIDRNKTYVIDAKNISFGKTTYTYTGKKILPEVTVKFRDGSDSANLVYGKDYTLVYGSDNGKKLGKHSIVLKGIGSFTGSKTLKFKIVANLEDCKVKLSYTSTPADGHSKKPAVSVTCNGLKLKEGTHYSVSYSNNKKPGTASVKLTGIEKAYTVGNKTEHFTIFEKKQFYKAGCIFLVTNDSPDAHEVMVADADPATKNFIIPTTVTYEGTKYQVTSIGTYAFKNCKIVRDVIVGANVKSIGNNAFYGCVNLETITLPGDLETIGSKAFNNCLSLKKITIPKKVTKIGQGAFLGCKLLSKITIKTDLLTESSIGSSAFKNIHRKAVVYVNYDKVATYKKILKKKGLSGSAQKVLPIKK